MQQQVGSSFSLFLFLNPFIDAFMPTQIELQRKHNLFAKGLYTFEDCETNIDLFKY